MVKGKKEWQKPGFKLFLMTAPLLVMVFLFSYMPLAGWIYAFYDYRAGMKLANCDFVGLKHFISIFNSPVKLHSILRVMKNTLGISMLNIIASPLPMVVAILLNELRSVRYRKTVQTLTTLPHFISWVLVYSVAFSMFSTDGLVNQVLLGLGLTEKGINFLADPNHTWLKMWGWNMWKVLGWDAIMYLAAIGSVDKEQVEAAQIDGAGRWKVIWHVEVPALLPTFFVLLLMSISNIINCGMEQFYVFSNAMNKSSIEVLDLYVYNQGLGSNQIPYATAVGMLKSVISVTLLAMANGMSKTLRGESIF